MDDAQIVAQGFCKLRGFHSMPTRKFLYCAYSEELCECGALAPQHARDLISDWPQIAKSNEVRWPA